MRKEFIKPTQKTLTEIEGTKEALKLELALIQEWFKENDWKVNKISLGEWSETDERAIAYRAERLAKRNRQDEINALLNEYE